ncbi:MAG: replication-associated recombination protein A [Phycisphaerales bacterium]|nr:replication-associated recombination protein A [Phycisphaerales bacterium]
MSDLWAQQRAQHRDAAQPLAARMRPTSLEEFSGQRHFLGSDQLLTRMLAADRLTSVLFWGPPGTGKTALSGIIAGHTGCHFVQANAALVGVKDIRQILQDARSRVETGGGRTILFLDEIHRFARNQQDVLLADVEAGLITLIGATTENPFFTVNSALISRSTLFQFEPLGEEDIHRILTRAMTHERGFGGMELEISAEAIEHWVRISDGDARRALNAMEVAVCSQLDGEATSQPRICIDLETAEQSIQAKALRYDRDGDGHYDHASALIKSIRGSDPDAAVYWLACMLSSGEDPRFICRRLAILASEDIGLASPQALQMAAAAWTVTERVGMPECQLTLSELAIYLATCPKSNATAQAIWTAMADVRDGRTVPVPRFLRDSHYAGADAIEHGTDYRNPHADADAGTQDYLGVDRTYYEPTDQGFESKVARRMPRDSAGEESTHA